MTQGSKETRRWNHPTGRRVRARISGTLAVADSVDNVESMYDLGYASLIREEVLELSLEIAIRDRGSRW